MQTKSKDGTKIGLHAASNLIGRSEKQKKKIGKIYEPGSISNKMNQLRLSLNESEYKVLEGILGAISDSNYQGHTTPVNVEDLIKRGIISEEQARLTDALSKIPRLRIGKEQVYDWGGAKKNHIGSRERALQGLEKLSRTTFTFCYERLKYKENGEPVKNDQGVFEKETMIYEDTLFNLATVRDQATGREYFEIIPSLVFLDQIDKYFVIIPKDWRKDIQLATNKRKVPSAAYRLIFFLIIQYELKRRNKAKHELSCSTQTICEHLDIPKAYIKTKKKYLKGLFSECYDIAKKCGYIENYEFDDNLHKIFFREGKYYNPGEKMIQMDIYDTSASSRKECMEFYYKELQEKGVKKGAPRGTARSNAESQFEKLLERYKDSQIKQAIRYALSHRFWASQILTPAKLVNKFDEILIELTNSATNKEIEKRVMVENLVAEIPREVLKNLAVQIEIKDEYAEVIISGQSKVFEYKAKNFEEKFSSYIQKIKAHV